MSLVMRNCVSVVVPSSSSIVPLLAINQSHFAWVATRRHSPITRVNAKPRLTVSSLDDAAEFHWLDLDDRSPDLPLQQAFV